jgi:hypothetical protein
MPRPSGPYGARVSGNGLDAALRSCGYDVAMSDLSDTAPPKRRRTSRKAVALPSQDHAEAVQALIEHAMHPDAVATDLPMVSVPVSMPEGEPISVPPPSRQRSPRKRIKSIPLPPAATVTSASRSEEAIDSAAIVADASMEDSTAEHIAHDNCRDEDTVVETTVAEDAAFATSDDESGHSDHRDDDQIVQASSAENEPPDGGSGAIVTAAPAHHRWVYLGLGIFLLSLAFGLWGVWTTWFVDDDASGQDVLALRTRSDKLSQEVSTLRRSDQISREANRDLERTLAERDEEIAGLRADIAFYERFVGATGQRRGLSVHDLDLRLQSTDAWHFVATLTQNLNRGAINSGRVTLSVEGTRNDRLEKLSWSSLRKLSNAPGVDYSFKYFQQVEGEVILPKDFKPLRVTVRLVPAGGSAVEQSFPWSDIVRGDAGG